MNITFRAIIDDICIVSDRPFTSAAMKRMSESTPLDGKFEFLLFVLDSLEGRRLFVDSSFYLLILVLGTQAGGLNKQIVSLLTQSRKTSNQKEISVYEEDSPDQLCLTLIIT